MLRVSAASVVGVRWCRPRRRIENRVERGRRLGDHGELFGLIGGDEILDRADAVDLRQRLEPAAHLLGRSRRGHQDVDAVAGTRRVAPQVEIGRDRFDLRTAQVHRIEVEPQVVQQRQAGDGKAQRRNDDGDSVAFQKIVDRGEHRESEPFLLARRVENKQQRRQHRDAGQVGDEHADAGDLAEFGYAAIGGGQERQEARRNGGGGKRERNAGAGAGLHQREAQVRHLEPFLAIANAELDAEIHPEADEQHRECHRDEVQRSDHHQPDRRRQRQADEESRHDRQDDSEGAQGKPQDEQDDAERDRGIGRRAFLERPEFVVCDRNRPGEPDARLVARREVEAGDGVADGVGGDAPGLKGTKIELRRNLDHAAQFARSGAFAAGEFAPGKLGRLTGQHVLQRRRRERERGCRLIEREFMLAHAGEDQCDHLAEPTQARIGCHHPHQRRRLGQLMHHRADVPFRQEQHAVAGKEGGAAELRHRGEQHLVLGQFIDQGGACECRQLRRRPIDHRQDEIVTVGK